jgi:hypothetical protein
VILLESKFCFLEVSEAERNSELFCSECVWEKSLSEFCESKVYFFRKLRELIYLKKNND